MAEIQRRVFSTNLDFNVVVFCNSLAHLWSLLQEPTEVAQEVPPHGTQEFTLAQIMAATNNFVLDTKIHCGSSGIVYRGRLHDGREVAIKHFNYHEYSVKDFSTELDNLSRLLHKHIICLLGSCVTVTKDKRLQTTLQKKKEGPANQVEKGAGREVDRL